jgi:hypothetical protein
MSQPVEISLRIPNMKTRPLDENGYPIDYAGIRFRKVETVASIPKPGDTLRLVASGTELPATVVRADWSENAQMFIVACQFGERSITPERHSALVADPEWRAVPLI